MAKLSILGGATSVTIPVFIQDSSKTDGSGLTGLAFNTASLTAYYVLPRAASSAITLVTLAAVTSSWSSGGFKEIDATNMPGWYRLDVPNAAIASGNRSCGIHLQGATHMAPCPLEIELTGWDNQDAVHGGLSCLPATACTGNASLLTSGTGTDQISVASGVAKANVAQILGTALTETAGQIAAGFKQFFNIASPTSTMNLVTAVTTLTTYTGNTPQTGDSYARIGVNGAGLTAVGGGGDTPGTTTLLSRVGTPVLASISADIANLANGSGLFAPCVVSTVTGASSIVVSFSGTAPSAGGLVNLYCCMTSTAHAPEKQIIGTATAVDSTHVALTFATPFGVTPTVGDTALVG